MLRTGISYRHPMAVWVDSRPPNVDFLEILSSIFVRAEMANRLAMLANAFSLAMRSTALSLGTPGPLREDLLQPLVNIATTTNPMWISEPIGFSRTGEIDLKYFCPVAPSDDSVAIIADHAIEVSSRCGCAVLLENFSSPLRFERPMAEPEFLNRLCERSGSNLLLDVTSLYVNSRNHAFDPQGWLTRLNPAYIAQIHVAGYRQGSDGYEDLHDTTIQSEIWDLVQLVLAQSHDAGGIIEHDIDIPSVEILDGELNILKDMGAFR